jgi:hypothetical protein
MTALRGMELRIAEDMTAVLDYVSRVKQGIDGGDWHYVLDKAVGLAKVAQQLADAAGYEIDHRRTKPREAARPDAIVVIITRDARHYAAGRALYPEPAKPEREAADTEKRLAEVAEVIANATGAAANHLWTALNTSSGGAIARCEACDTRSGTTTIRSGAVPPCTPGGCAHRVSPRRDRSGHCGGCGVTFPVSVEAVTR